MNAVQMKRTTAIWGGVFSLLASGATRIYSMNMGLHNKASSVSMLPDLGLVGSLIRYRTSVNFEYLLDKWRGYSHDGPAAAIRIRRFHVWALTIIAVLLLCTTHDAERLQAQTTLTDRQILEALYDATGGANWTDNSGWKGPGAVCTWYGIRCESNEVRVLSLRGNNLLGPIPSELGNLSGLERLILAENQLTGSIPSSLGQLTSLTFLSLWANQLTDPIPSELGNLQNLTQLWINRNNLSGPIPPELGTLSGLERLSLAANQLTGSIPPELGDLANLTHLWINGNNLSGSIPPELGNLSGLERLSLAANQLTGSIPPELGNLSSLEGLSLAENQLTGPIPPELGNLSSLEGLSLAENQLTGSIPSSLGQLTSLTFLSLWGNRLAGSIPSELGRLSSLERLNLSDNQLTGSIPSWLGQLTSLTLLSLWTNQLTGPIPSELGNLTNLTGLYLGRNRLTGSIPASLGQLTLLTFLGLFTNQLTGSIPSELGSLTSLQRLNLSNNQLTGPIPSELGDLTNLTQLWINGNNLSGSIPPELGNLSSLERLNLAHNQLTGDVPDLNNVPLSWLGLGGNDLNLSWDTFASTGPVNLETKSNSMERLYLNDSGIEGEIPDWVGDVHTHLAMLWLQNNSLTGQIPANFANLTELADLRLAGNMLTGNLDALTGLTYVTVSATEALSNRGLSTQVGGTSSLVKITLPEDADATRSIVRLTAPQTPDLEDIHIPSHNRYAGILSLLTEVSALDITLYLRDDRGIRVDGTPDAPTVVCFAVPATYADQEVVVLKFDSDDWEYLESADPPSGFHPGTGSIAVCGMTESLSLFVPAVVEVTPGGAAVPTAMPEEEPTPPDTGGSVPSGSGLLIFVIFGVALTFVGVSLTKAFRKRGLI